MDILRKLKACHGIQSGDPDCNCQEAAAEIERLQARERTLENTAKLNLKVAKDRGAKIERLTAIIRDAVEALERGSTSAPVLEGLKAALAGKPHPEKDAEG